MSRVLIGHCGVDSGQIMLVDPCYVTDNRFEDTPMGELMNRMDKAKAVAPEGRYVNRRNPKNHEFSYGGACEATVGYGHGQLDGGMAVVTATAHGDGSYPVYAELGRDGNVISVTIEFDLPDGYQECGNCGEVMEESFWSECEHCQAEEEEQHTCDECGEWKPADGQDICDVCAEDDD